MLGPDPVAIFVPRFNALGGIWAITGSIASMTYGEVRSTNDIDIVVLFGEAEISALERTFAEPDFYCPPAEIVREEQRRPERGHVNVIHIPSGYKADLYFSGKDGFTVWALRTRRAMKFGEEQLWLTPPEYVIVRKLEFFHEGGSEKHIRDIRGMLAVTDVDRQLIEREIAQRGLGELWKLCARSVPRS